MSYSNHRERNTLKGNQKKGVDLYPHFFLSKKFQLISEIRSLSADRQPSLLGTSACGVSASQLFGRSVANFFNLKRFHSFNQVKNIKDIQIFFKITDRGESIPILLLSSTERSRSTPFRM